MKYHFFLCKERFPDYAACILKQIPEDRNRSFKTDDRLLPFDLDRVFSLLRNASEENAETVLRFRFRQVCGLPLVAVTTSFRKAQEVFDALSGVAAAEGLSVYDGEMGCSRNIPKRAREEFVTARLAHQRFMVALRHHPRLDSSRAKQVEYCELGECFCFSPTVDTAIMVLKGDFPGAVNAVNDTLSANLSDGEELCGEDGCFVVKGGASRYKIRFVVEGPRKSGPFMGWIENGVLRIELLRRMSVYRGLRRLWKMGEGEEEYVRSRLYFDEDYATRGEWRNPADRFVDGIKTSEWLGKNKLGLIYGRHPKRHCSEFLFFADDETDLGWDFGKTVSRFALTEEEAAPLLGLIEDVVPYYYNYYYEKFHVRKEEADLVLERLKTVRLKVVDNPTDPALGKLAERFLQSSFAWKPPNRSDDESVWEEPKEILSRRRFELLALLDFFGGWIERLKSSSTCTFDGFYVEGP